MSRDKTRFTVLGRLLPPLLLLAASPTAQGAAPLVTDVVAVPLKSGTRAAVTWRTNVATTGVVTYGVTPDAAVGRASPRGAATHPATTHLAVLDLLSPGRTYYVAITAVGAGGTATALTSFVARNASGVFDAASSAYRLNLLVRFDWDLTGEEMAAWESQLTTMAIRVNDMTDGWVNVGTVVLADAAGAEPSGFTYCSVAECISGADVAVFTGVGIDLWAAGLRAPVMWPQSRIGGIGMPDAAIEVPRYMNQPLPEAETARQPYTGAMLAHELGHYALWLADQYGAGGEVCSDAGYDVSIMNSLGYTEIDSEGTPCAWQATHGTTGWDVLRSRYPAVSTRAGTPLPGPADPGPALRLIGVNRGVR